MVGGQLWCNVVTQNYSDIGFDLVDSGGQGGNFNPPWEGREECLKQWVGFFIISFDILMVEVCGIMIPSVICSSHVVKPTGFPTLFLR